ncbi:Bcr/CflA family drug resistance efflux transporter [Bacillus cereus]|uniref:multidrug effflux MFS transporter n=1 Tax=Bacillus cereus TaxID=1396 RepID=UPI000BF0108C|nr:multidrug effflux MFS transporter [Bacillus cereus]PEL95613.1 Bcr/CflA family drug resistance efflux transporter [Bacillus cereus]
MKKNKVPSLLLIMVLVVFPQISETIFTPALSDISKDLHVSANTTQLTLSIYFAGFALGVFFWGWLSDIIGRRPAMLWGILIYGMGSLFCYLAHSIEFLLFSRFIQAFGASTGSVITQTIIRESIDGNKRHAVFAQISAAIAFAPAVGPLVGGWVDQFFGFRSVFFTLVIMSVGIFVYTVTALPETRSVSTMNRKINVLSVFTHMIRNPKVLTFGLLIGGANGILFSYYGEAPFIFIDYFKMSPGLFGFLGIVVALSSILGAHASKRLLNLFKPEKIINIGCLVMTIGAIILSVITLTGTQPTLLYAVTMLIAIFILFLGIGVTLPNCLSLALVDFQDVIGTAGSVFGLGYYLVVTFITWGMSQVHTGSLVKMSIYFLVLSIIMAMMSRFFIYTSHVEKTA